MNLVSLEKVPCESFTPLSLTQANINSRAYPWSKLLELLIYTPHLQPPICPHHTTPHAYITLFRTSSYTASLTSSPVKLYDIRLPKLQIGPNVPKRKVGGGRQGMGLMMDDAKEGENGLKREVERWCEALENRIDIMVHLHLHLQQWIGRSLTSSTEGEN